MLACHAGLLIPMRGRLCVSRFRRLLCSPDLLTDTGLAVRLRFLCQSITHSRVSVQSPPSYSSASRLALLEALLHLQQLRGEPLLGPQQEPTAAATRFRFHPLVLHLVLPQLIWGCPPLRFQLGPPLQVTLILILPCLCGLCCSVQGYLPKAFCVVLPSAFSWTCFLVLKNLLVLQFCLSTIQLCRLTSCWIPVWTS